MAGVSVVNQWTNADGLTVSLTPAAWPKTTIKEVVGNPIHTVVMHVVLSDLATNLTAFPRDLDNDGVTDGFSNEDFHFEAGDIILEAKAIVGDTAATTGTLFLAGTYKIDGTGLKSGGLINPINGARANLTANTVVTGSGALIGDRITQDSYLTASVSGKFSTGEVDLVVTYMRLPN